MTTSELVLTAQSIEDSDHAKMLAESVLAEIKGMEAENTHRLNCGLSIAYGEEAFFTASEALLHIAQMMGGKLGGVA